MAATIILALAPIFFVLAVGYCAGRLHMVDNRNVDSLNVLVMTFALPAALFMATASAPRGELMAQAPDRSSQGSAFSGPARSSRRASTCGA